jgi:hypothetical protein
MDFNDALAVKPIDAPRACAFSAAATRSSVRKGLRLTDRRLRAKGRRRHVVRISLTFRVLNINVQSLLSEPAQAYLHRDRHANAHAIQSAPAPAPYKAAVPEYGM